MLFFVAQSCLHGLMSIRLGRIILFMAEGEPEILGDITDIEIIAISTSIRELARLRQAYGGTRWRKLKGIAFVRTEDGEEFWAEVHWYECHGIGRRRVKVKRKFE